MPGATALLRNEPVQARSTARLTSLLDAAAEVVDEIGFERLTTAMVAERAGASIGTVYRYFPDRIAVLQSLAARSLAQFSQRIRPALTEPVQENWWEAVNTVFDNAVDAFGSVARLPVPSVRGRHRRASGYRRSQRKQHHLRRDRLCARVDLGLPDDDELRLRVEVALTIADSLLARAFATERKGDSRYIEEARSVVRSYLVGHYGEPAAA